MIEQESVETHERVIDRIHKYLPSRETIEAHPSPSISQTELREELRQDLAGADFVMVFSHLEEKLVIVPPWHDLNLAPVETPGKDYAQVVFEGMSMEPVVDEEDIKGANLILFQPRIDRLVRSVTMQRFNPSVSIAEFSQGISDLCAVLGEKVLRREDNTPSRAYIRPSISRGLGKFGVASSSTQKVDATIAVWNWPFYLPDPERVYQGEGLKVAVFTDEQRIGKIYGKEARNYGHAGVVSRRAKELGQDEALIFGPYQILPRIPSIIQEVNLQRRFVQSLDEVLDVVLSDGPGEEVAAVTKSEELWTPPMDVNRLGGTTLNYLRKYMAPKLGIKTYVRAFSLRNILEGDICGLIFLGNAARIAPIGEIKVYDSTNDLLSTINLEIPPVIRELVDRYEQEVSARVEPSHESLLTLVDLESGKSARKVLDEVYSSWF